MPWQLSRQTRRCHFSMWGRNKQTRCCACKRSCLTRMSKPGTARLKSEVDLWSELATKLTGTHSTSEAMGAYQECVAKRMQMAAEDGRRLSDDCQKVMQMITRSMSNGWPTTAAGT